MAFIVTPKTQKTVSGQNASRPIESGYYRVTRDIKAKIQMHGLDCNEDGIVEKGTIVWADNWRHKDEDGGKYYAIYLKDSSGCIAEYNPHGNGHYDKTDTEVFEKTQEIADYEKELQDCLSPWEFRDIVVDELQNQHPLLGRFLKKYPQLYLGPGLGIFAVLGTFACMLLCTIVNWNVSGFSDENFKNWPLLITVIPTVFTLIMMWFIEHHVDKPSIAMHDKIEKHNEDVAKKIFALEEATNMTPVTQATQKPQDILNQCGTQEEFCGLYLFHTTEQDENTVAVR